MFDTDGNVVHSLDSIFSSHWNDEQRVHELLTWQEIPTVFATKEQHANGRASALRTRELRAERRFREANR